MPNSQYIYILTRWCCIKKTVLHTKYCNEKTSYYSIKDKLVHLDTHITYLGREANEFSICGMRYHVHLCDSLVQSGLHFSLNINRISYNFA